MFLKFFITFCILFSFNTFAAGFAPVANVVKIKGTVLIDNQKIREGAEVAQGMDLKIPKKGDYVEVKFQNGHVVRLVGAHVKVEDLTPKSTIFHLIKGKIFSAIESLSKDETFVVKTRSASFGVRGTKFFIEENSKESYLCVCEGVVSAKTTSGEVDVSKDQDLYIRGKKSLEVKAASKNMLNLSNNTFKDMGVL